MAVMAGAALSLALAAPAAAQSVTLTEGAGRPLIVGGPSELGQGLAPATLTPQALAAEFQRLCLPDPAAAAARAAESPLALVADDAVFPATGKQQEVRVAQWRGPSATLAVSSGDAAFAAGLKGRPIVIPSRALAVTGGYGPWRADGVQCNLVVMLPDFAAATALSEALTANFGAPGKLVVKKTFADGYWQTKNTPSLRINFNTPTTRSGPQPVHLSAQQLPEKDGNR
jgi:hypothetical protein